MEEFFFAQSYIVLALFPQEFFQSNTPLHPITDHAKLVTFEVTISYRVDIRMLKGLNCLLIKTHLVPLLLSHRVRKQPLLNVQLAVGAGLDHLDIVGESGLLCISIVRNFTLLDMRYRDLGQFFEGDVTCLKLVFYFWFFQG